MTFGSMGRYYKPAMTLVALLLLTLAFTGLIDKTGQEVTEAAFKRALLTFGVARGLNGAISVAQGTEISISPGGLGLNLTPGEILDPVNDLIERFSWVMLMSSTSLGIQQIFITISSSLAATLLVSIAVLLALFLLWRPSSSGPGVQGFVFKLALMLLILRFAVPVGAIGSEWIYSYFLSDQYQQSTELLEDTSSDITDLNRASQPSGSSTEEPGLIDRASRWLDSASESLEIEARMERYKETATKASEHAINLIVVFVIQTIILPLVFLWLMVRFIRKVWD